MTTDRLAEVLKAIADPVRLRILGLLKPGELCVCELVAALDMTQPAVSQHLTRLKSAKLVKDRRQGQWTLYELAPDREARPLVEAALAAAGPLGRERLRLKAFSSETGVGSIPGRRCPPPRDLTRRQTGETREVRRHTN
ncbi:MAG: ArsR/SmtB family transcription factor [Bacillota bacterium]